MTKSKGTPSERRERQHAIRMAIALEDRKLARYAVTSFIQSGASNKHVTSILSVLSGTSLGLLAQGVKLMDGDKHELDPVAEELTLGRTALFAIAAVNEGGNLIDHVAEAIHGQPMVPVTFDITDVPHQLSTSANYTSNNTSNGVPVGALAGLGAGALAGAAGAGAAGAAIVAAGAAAEHAAQQEAARRIGQGIADQVIAAGGTTSQANAIGGAGQAAINHDMPGGGNDPVNSGPGAIALNLLRFTPAAKVVDAITPAILPAQPDPIGYVNGQGYYTQDAYFQALQARDAARVATDSEIAAQKANDAYTAQKLKRPSSTGY